MPKDQRTRWREAKQRYRDKQRDQSQGQPREESDDPEDFWTG